MSRGTAPQILKCNLNPADICVHPLVIESCTNDTRFVLLLLVPDDRDGSHILVSIQWEL